MENNRNPSQQSQPGSGSSENKGQDRTDQLHPHTDLSQEQRQSIADEIGENQLSAAGLKDLGARSGPG